MLCAFCGEGRPLNSIPVRRLNHHCLSLSLSISLALVLRQRQASWQFSHKYMLSRYLNRAIFEHSLSRRLSAAQCIFAWCDFDPAKVPAQMSFAILDISYRIDGDLFRICGVVGDHLSFLWPPHRHDEVGFSQFALSCVCTPMSDTFE